MALHRRKFVASAGLGLLAFQMEGAVSLLSPRQAKAQAVPLRILSPAAALIVDALGEALVPGAAAAGLTHYLDQQLAASTVDSLLMIRYLDVPPPYADFYKSGLASIDAAAKKIYDLPVHALTATQRDDLVRVIQRGDPQGWAGPPAPFFYFVLRSDAIDVVYGTPEGFAKLGIPYMPHIMPPSNW